MSGSIFVVIADIIGTFVGMFGTIIGGFFAAIGVTIAIALFLLEGYCLFVMAKKTEFKYPWFAFVPFLRTYLEFHIPSEDFNLWNVIRIKDRSTLAIICIIVPIAVEPILAFLTDIPYLGLLFIPVSMLFNIVVLIERWKRMYDVMKTFNMGGVAILLSIISVFVPIAYTIVLLVIFRRTPASLPQGTYAELS